MPPSSQEAKRSLLLGSDSETMAGVSLCWTKGVCDESEGCVSVGPPGEGGVRPLQKPAATSLVEGPSLSILRAGARLNFLASPPYPSLMFYLTVGVQSTFVDGLIT